MERMLEKIKNWFYWTFIDPKPYLTDRSTREMISNERTSRKLSKLIEKQRYEDPNNEGVVLPPELEKIVRRYGEYKKK